MVFYLKSKGTPLAQSKQGSETTIYLFKVVHHKDDWLNTGWRWANRMQGARSTCNDSRLDNDKDRSSREGHTDI